MNGENGFCDECGVYVDMSPDIRGVESGEGRVVDGRLLCTGCADSLEGVE